MNTIFKRIAAGETTNTNPGPTISRPIPHQLFPTQDFVVPGNWSHHHHQWHRGW